MKTKLAKTLALLLAAALCVAMLSGCSLLSSASLFSAQELVQGNLDLVYLHKYTDDYLELVDLTAEEADEQYEEGLEVQAEYFASYFQIVLDSCDDGIEDRIVELCRSIFLCSKYEVGDQSKSGDTYLVSLTVYPIDIVQKVVDEDFDAYAEDWNTRAENGEFDSMSDEEYETAWAEGLLDIFDSRMESIGYLDPETISVQITANDDDLYSISDNDFSRIDALILAY